MRIPEETKKTIIDSLYINFNPSLNEYYYNKEDPEEVYLLISKNRDEYLHIDLYYDALDIREIDFTKFRKISRRMINKIKAEAL